MSGSSGLIGGVDFVSIPTADIGRAREFYGGVLGLESSAVWQKGDEEPLGAEFETGTVTLALIDSAGVGIEPRPNVVPIALHVDDVAAAKAALEEKGVEFGGEIVDSGVCHMAHFADPDGNVLMLHHRYAPPRS